jgi:hypothetical protein
VPSSSPSSHPGPLSRRHTPRPCRSCPSWPATGPPWGECHLPTRGAVGERVACHSLTHQLLPSFLYCTNIHRAPSVCRAPVATSVPRVCTTQMAQLSPPDRSRVLSVRARQVAASVQRPWGNHTVGLLKAEVGRSERGGTEGHGGRAQGPTPQ